MDRIITVTGNAHVKKAPELAYLSLAITAQEKTRKAAQEAQAQTMHDVLGALDLLGVPKAAQKTTRYNVQQAHKYDEKRHQNVPDGFMVTQQLTVTVDVDAAEEIVGVLGKLPVVLSVGFGLKDHDQETNAALCLAIANARTKAEAMARACTCELGPVVSCEEEAHRGGGGIRMMSMSAGLEAAGGSAPELPTGEIEISASVTMQFVLK